MSKANRFNRNCRTKDWRAPLCKLPDFRQNIVTRQQRRAHKRAVALQGITEQFGGEPRQIRRAMAFVLAKRKGAQP